MPLLGINGIAEEEEEDTPIFIETINRLNAAFNKTKKHRKDNRISK